MTIAASFASSATLHDPRAHERANLVGRVIWEIVRPEGQRPERSLFLLADLSAEHLRGLSRTFPAAGSFRLAIDPRIDPALLSSLPAEHLTQKPAVRLRNVDSSGAILIAVRDKDRTDVGASLGQVPFLDRDAIQGATAAWVAALKPAFSGTLSPEKEDYLVALVAGLAGSGAAKSLDQFAQVLDGFVADPSLEFDERLRGTAVALRLPRNCYGKMPSAAAVPAAPASTLRAMFRDAEREVRNIPYLLAQDQKRLDTQAILARVGDLRVRAAAGEDGPPEAALAAVEALIADRQQLKPGIWRPSQQAFCEAFDWKAFGRAVFEARTVRTTKTLAELTRTYFEDEREADLTLEDRAFLNELESDVASDERVEAFFDRHRGRLADEKSGKLLKAWRQRVYPNVVKDEPNLLSGLLRGVQALLIKAAIPETGLVPAGLRLAVSAKNATQLSTWSGMDQRTYRLFRLEMLLIKDVLGDIMVDQLGKCFAHVAPPERGEVSSSPDARSIELDLRLIDPSDKPVGEVVRVTWRPSPGRSRSISLSLPGDIERLHANIGPHGVRLRYEGITPGGCGDDAAVSLERVESFGDVGGSDAGRTTDPSRIGPGEEWFEKVEAELGRLLYEHRTLPADVDRLRRALAMFRQAFTAVVRGLHEEPERCLSSNLIPDAARAFGELCEAARQALWRDLEARQGAMRQICEFGLATSTSSVAVAIVPAWHPLRLLERRAKALAVAALLRDALTSEAAGADGVEREASAMLRVLDRWHLPELVTVGLREFVCVEDVGGYGLAVPAERALSNTQALEASARPARDQFMAVVDEYLRLNPHEEGNFATAIYNAESVELPRLVADALEARMEGRDHVRCGLLITHDDADRVRRTFALQNTRLQGRSSGVDGGFLSRLRVGVRTGRGSNLAGQRPDIDLLFLHDVFVQMASLSWDYVPGSSSGLQEDFDLRSAMRPRRRLGSGAAGSRLDLALMVDNPPRALASFIDLCHATSSAARAIPPDERAVPRRHID